MIDFCYFFAHIMGKRKIASHYLKIVGIFISNICHYMKINNGNKSFVSIVIIVIFFYDIRIGTRVTTITTFT